MALIDKLHRHTIRGGSKRPLTEKQEDKLIRKLMAFAMSLNSAAVSQAGALIRDGKVDKLISRQNLIDSILREIVIEQHEEIKGLFLEFKSKLVKDSGVMHMYWNTKFIESTASKIIKIIEDKIAEDMLFY